MGSVDPDDWTPYTVACCRCGKEETRGGFEDCRPPGWSNVGDYNGGVYRTNPSRDLLCPACAVIVATEYAQDERS